MPGNIAIFVPHAGCKSQCSFCNQRTISGAQQPPTPDEVAETCRTALAGLRAGTGTVEIAFFGGSFTAIPRGQMIALLAAAQPFLADSRVVGIRISTRPDAIDGEVLGILQAFGVTAIELGAQSMDEAVLEQNHRGHTPQAVINASGLIKAASFSLGLQMMTGLLGATPTTDYATGLSLAALLPDTVRIYPTVVLAGTRLAEELLAGRYCPPGVEETIPLCACLLDLFESRGIRVIRLGLQASRELEWDILGGCYHPAFGELVAGERYYHQIVTEAERLGGTRFLLKFSPKKQSQILGQKKRNVACLLEKGYNIKYQNDSGLTDRDFALEREKIVEAEGN